MTAPQTEKLLKGVYKGTIDKDNLPIGYYKDAANGLMSSLKRGWGIKSVGPRTPYLDKFTELADSAYTFAAAKTYQVTRELSAAAEGKETFDAFKEEADVILNRYDSYGEAEENSTVAQGQMAKQWGKFEEEKDILPNLRYSTIGDACDICAPFDGLTAPIDDPIWAKITPINHPNCFCLLLQENELVKTSNKTEVGSADDHADSSIVEWCRQNAGQTGDLFGKDHPYYTEVPKEDRKYAAANFDLPIPSKYK